MMEQMPITPALISDETRADVAQLQQGTARIKSSSAGIYDWLRHEFGFSKSIRTIENAHLSDADAFVAAVRAALPKSRKFSSAEIARLKQEHADTLAPAREAAAQLLALERKLSDLVNAAYGLTPEEVALMWRTAPPRMPLDPKEELRRLSFTN
jgi:acyl-CoA reductase-like NAD-dependent aldehyde dehydrogenase